MNTQLRSTAVVPYGASFEGDPKTRSISRHLCSQSGSLYGLPERAAYRWYSNLCACIFVFADDLYD